ncbi:hypothetical protein [Pseudomonas guariconensis]|uniref:hypothetical protein n=1 Tax=Pseudomonas guariconensis TaxID=1288410 RepID=UPI001E51FCC0|nr:hypothetical protein [Pseudomonas guariconensis]
MKRFLKPAISVLEQLALLIRRGLVIQNEATFLWPKHLQHPGPHARVFTVLCILNLLMRHVSPHTSWDRRLHDLLAEFPEVPLHAMGFPSDWQEDPFWQIGI